MTEWAPPIRVPRALEAQIDTLIRSGESRGGVPATRGAPRVWSPTREAAPLLEDVGVDAFIEAIESLSNSVATRRSAWRAANKGPTDDFAMPEFSAPMGRIIDETRRIWATYDCMGSVKKAEHAGALLDRLLDLERRAWPYQSSNEAAAVYGQLGTLYYADEEVFASPEGTKPMVQETWDSVASAGDFVATGGVSVPSFNWLSERAISLMFFLGVYVKGLITRPDIRVEGTDWTISRFRKHDDGHATNHADRGQITPEQRQEVTSFFSNLYAELDATQASDELVLAVDNILYESSHEQLWTWAVLCERVQSGAVASQSYLFNREHKQHFPEALALIAKHIVLAQTR